MRKLIVLLISVAVLSSCGSTIQTLYYWGGEYGNYTVYEKAAYDNYKSKTPQSICALVYTYENMVKHPGGLRQMPPPGICAEYGYLLLMPETATVFADNATAGQKAVFGTTDYASYFRKHGEEMLRMEISLYPESETFIKPLINKWLESN